MDQYQAAIELLIKAQNQTGPAFADLNNSLARTKTSLDTAGIASSIFTGLLTGGAARALQSFGDAAREQETATLRLSAAVDANGGNWERDRVQIEKNIETYKRFAFSDNQLMDALSQLTVETGSFEKAQDRLTLAMDVSRGMKIDLSMAARLLGRVNDENIAGLQRLGFAIRKGATEEEALAQVQAQVAGQAEKYATGQAAWADRLGNALSEAKAHIGEMLGPVAALSTVLRSLPEFAGGAAGAVKFFTQQVEIGSVTTTRFAGILSGLSRGLPALARGFGTAALLAGEFFAIIEGAAALGRAGVPVLDQFANKDRTGSLDLVEKIAERGQVGQLLHDLAVQQGPGTLRGALAPIPGFGQIGALVEIKDQITGVGKESAKSTSEVDRLRKSLGSFPDLAAKLGGLMGRGGGGLSTAGASAAAMVKELQDAFGPFGIKEGDPAFKQFEDILNNVVGLTPEGRYKELGDQLYKRFHDKVQGELVDPLLKIKEEIDQPGKAGVDALAQYAKEAGKSPQQFLADFNKELSDAQKRLADTDHIVKQLIDRGAQEQKDAVEAFHNRQEDLLMTERQSVWDTKAAYDQLNAARAGQQGIGGFLQSAWNFLTGPPTPNVGQPNLTAPGGGGSRLMQLGTDMTVSRPTWLHVGEQGVRERIRITPEGVGRGAGGSGAVTIMPGAIALNYGGPADKPAAARLSADIVENVTEALRQGFRRIGDRSTPLGIR